MTKAFPNSVIFDAAPTLEALKKLPIETKSWVLLARLFKIGAHDTSALNKHNLMMVGDPYQLAYGYGHVENHAVRQHLLGAPWTRLVNEGYLADYGGQGFFTVTDEGREFRETDLSSAPGATAAASAGTFSGEPFRGRNLFGDGNLFGGTFSGTGNLFGDGIFSGTDGISPNGREAHLDLYQSGFAKHPEVRRFA